MSLREIVKEIIGGAKQARSVTHFKGKPTSVPATPQPRTHGINKNKLTKRRLELIKEYETQRR